MSSISLSPAPTTLSIPAPAAKTKHQEEQYDGLARDDDDDDISLAKCMTRRLQLNQQVLLKKKAMLIPSSFTLLTPSLILSSLFIHALIQSPSNPFPFPYSCASPSFRAAIFIRCILGCLRVWWRYINNATLRRLVTPPMQSTHTHTHNIINYNYSYSINNN